MSETAIVRGAGGAIFEMDIPESGFGRERFDEQVARGDLLILPVEAVKWVEEISAPVRKDGEPSSTRRLVLVEGYENTIPADVPPLDPTTPAPSSDGQEPDGLGSLSKPELFDIAIARGIETKASWSKAQLLDAIEASPDPDADPSGGVEDTPAPDEE